MPTPMQLQTWACAAAIPVGIQLLSGAAWTEVALIAAVCLILVALRWRCGSRKENKPLCILRWLLLTAVLCALSTVCTESWPKGGHKAVPLLLLALAAWSAWKGPEAAARVGCVLFFFIIILYPVLIASASKQVYLPWLKPERSNTCVLGLLVLLTPAAAASMLRNKEWPSLRQLLPGLLCTAAAAVSAGVLSAKISATQNNAFHRTVLSLPGIPKDALLSASTTAGWFLMMSLYLCLCAQEVKTICPEKQKGSILIPAGIAALCLLYDLHIPATLLAVSGAVFWVVIPLIPQEIGLKKKS